MSEVRSVYRQRRLDTVRQLQEVRGRVVTPPDLREILKDMRDTAKGWETRNYRYGSSDKFGAGQEERALVVGWRVTEWADKISAALAGQASGSTPGEISDQLQALRDEFYAALVVMRNYYAQAISRAAVDEVLVRGWKMIKQTDAALASQVGSTPQKENQ